VCTKRTGAYLLPHAGPFQDLVYIQPEVLSEMRKGKNKIACHTAFVRAVKSRGPQNWRITDQEIKVTLLRSFYSARQWLRKKMPSKRSDILISSNSVDKMQGILMMMEHKIASFPRRILDDKPGGVSKTTASYGIDSSRSILTSSKSHPRAVSDDSLQALSRIKEAMTMGDINNDI
jgi:hypothetical protein